jgi:hypothetical protein
MGTITIQQNKAIHALLNQLEAMSEKNSLVEITTKHRTNSSTEMNYGEANHLITHLKQRKQQELGRMQGKIISYMRLMGYIMTDGKENMDKINTYIKNIGKKNPKQRVLWDLHKSELLGVLNQVETRYKKEVSQASSVPKKEGEQG